MDICEYVCIYAHTYIKMRIVNWRGRSRKATHGCPRVPTGLEKSAFFLVFTNRKCPFKGQKCTKILVVGLFRLDTWSLPTSDDQNLP